MDRISRSSPPAGPLVEIVYTAGRHVVDGAECGFGPLVVLAVDSAGPLGGPGDVGIGAASWGCGRDGPGGGFGSRL